MIKNALHLLLALLLLAPIVGCKGCQQEKPKDDKAKKEEEEKKKKQRLVADELRVLPFSTESVGNTIKPGHWYQARHKLKANAGDESLTATVEILSKERQPLPFTQNGSPIEFQRGVALAKEQEKYIDLKFFHPNVSAQRNEDKFESKPSSATRVRYALRGIGTPILEEEFPSKFLEGYQYNFLVLARDQSRYTFWRGLDCIIWPRNDEMVESRIAPHRIVDIKEDEVATQFPNRLYTMTSISHMVVNDFSMNVLSPDQLTAVKDWLHFGGTIIINGPDALAGVESSFLRDLAPIQNTRDSEVSEDEIEKLNSGWSIRFAGGERIPFKPNRKIPKLAGELEKDAAWLPALEGLVAERLVGQGRIVMTAFPMTDAAFIQWPSYSSLIHNAVLRKPYRDPKVGLEAETRFADAYEGSEMNPIHSTRLRLWARDLDVSTIRSDGEVRKKGKTSFAAKFPEGKSTSLCAWNSSSLVTENAVRCLRESSGITVPQIGTIVKLLVGYLIILVPINWLVFRLFGRVELAWVAAPIIALVGAFIVARSVQLDVGFSRSETTFGFLECHNDYERGMLSSYKALYTSLTTNYQAVYPDDGGVVLPMVNSGNRRTRDFGTTIGYSFASDRGAGLQSVPVLSNTTGLIQSEEMVKLSGPLSAKVNLDLLQVQLTNNSDIVVHDIGIVGIADDGRLLSGWVGSPEPNQTIKADLQVRDEDDRWRSEWDKTPVIAKPTRLRADDGVLWTPDEINDVYLGALLNELSEKYPLQLGEAIALGWTEAEVSQVKVAPVTNQKRQKTLVLLHLTAPKPNTEVRPDTRIFVKPKNDAEESN